jgi:cytochrome bd ubiquinol oxidase subunit II
MMLTIVIIFFLVSVYLYCLLGGADFGAGIIELFSRKRDKKRISSLVTEAIAPIWEANHMWLIIAVVILFNAFPIIYTSVSIALYIPLILLLLGIVFRGTAFTFRHYDAIKDHSQVIYSRIFAYSSLAVTFFFGLIVGALVSGKITTHPENFLQGYILPWLNLFSVTVGIFLCALFAFIAAVFLISESSDEVTREDFVSRSKKAMLVMVVSGGLVFLSSIFENVGFAEGFFSNLFSIALIIAATISLPVLWKIINKKMVWPSRILAGAQLLFIIGAFYAVYYPTVVVISDAEDLTLLNSAAPDITLAYLGWALLIGSVIIFPALFYLIKVFKLEGRT